MRQRHIRHTLHLGHLQVPSYRDYDTTPDGERLIMVFPADQGEASARQINMVLNWFQELTERVPIP